MFIVKYIIYALTLIVFTSNAYNQSMQDMQKMRAEYEKMRREGQSFNPGQQGREDIDRTTGLPNEVQIVPYRYTQSRDSLDFRVKHFGYDFFTIRDTTKFWENLPAPANYFLGPGDELVISLWGETQLRQTYTISRDGNIYDEKVGILNLMGKNIEGGEKYLSKQFGRVYSTLNGPNPSTYIDISLGKLRSINVNFVGEVNFPGVYPVHPFSNLITGLIQAGGVDTTGTLRNIQIKRQQSKIVSVDLYNYLLKGDLPTNIQLRDGDVVNIPVRLNSVSIDSGVIRPGIYEAKSGETIKKIIEYSGGLMPSSSASIGLRRILPLDDRNKSVPIMQNYYIDYSSSDLLEVRDGDEISVSKIFSINSR